MGNESTLSILEWLKYLVAPGTVWIRVYEEIPETDLLGALYKRIGRNSEGPSFDTT